MCKYTYSCNKLEMRFKRISKQKSFFLFSKSFEEKLVQIKYKNILNGVCCSTELSKLFIYKYVFY